MTRRGEVHGPGYPAPLRPDIYPPGWGEGAQARKEGVRGTAPRSLFLETNSWSSQRQNSWEQEISVSEIGPCMSRREIKIDVWKYMRPILMGLGAVWEEKLDNHGPGWITRIACRDFIRVARCVASHTYDITHAHNGMCS